MSTIDSLADDIMAGLQEYVSLANDSMKEAVKKDSNLCEKKRFPPMRRKIQVLTVKAGKLQKPQRIAIL